MQTRARKSRSDPSTHKNTSVTINNICQICDKKFTRSRDLIFHMSDTHAEMMTYECKKCFTKFYAINSFIQHMSSHSEIEVPTQEETVESDSPESPQQFHDHYDPLYHPPDDHSEQKYVCEVCGKVFALKSTLIRHMIVHTGVKNFVCELCGKAFGSAGWLSSHMNRHTDVRRFECKFCDKKFLRNNNLRQHLLTHNGIKKFKCETCKKAFLRLADLNRHMTFHNGVKNYKCDICEKSYSTSGHLARHKNSHTGNKPFRCDECGKCYAEKTLLAQHANIHSGVKFTCDTCEKTFTRKRSLARHKKIHLRGNIKKCKCETCGKTCSEKSCPKRHMINHEELKVPVSNKTFLDEVSATPTTISSIVEAVLAEQSTGASSSSEIPETVSEAP